MRKRAVCWLGITLGFFNAALTPTLTTSAAPSPATAAAQPEGHELIGTPARPFSELLFIGSPLKLQDLRGKVVLIRWWSDACPMCSGALPNLGRLYEQHKQEGLVVIGVYHPKPAAPLSAAAVQTIAQAAEAHEAHFPIATDADWTVLRRYWLDGGKRDFTSPTFLIDRQGIIRWVHPGGELHPSTEPAHKECDRMYGQLVSTLTTLLREPAPGKNPAPAP